MNRKPNKPANKPTQQSNKQIQRTNNPNQQPKKQIQRSNNQGQQPKKQVQRIEKPVRQPDKPTKQAPKNSARAGAKKPKKSFFQRLFGKKTNKKPNENTAQNPEQFAQSFSRDFSPKNARDTAQTSVQQPSKPVNKRTYRELSRVMNEKTRVRKKRRFRGGNYILYYIFAALVVALVLVILSNTVLFRCSEIEVVGNVRYTPEQIIIGSGLKTGDNLLHIDANAAAKKIVDICLFVDEAEVRKSFPTKLVVTVKEAEICFVISDENKNAAVSRGGRVIKYLEEPKNAIVLKGFEPESLELGAWLKSKNSTKTELPWDMLEKMEQAKLGNITDIDITDRYSPKVTIENRIILNLGSATELETKFIVAKTLIDTEVGKQESVTISLSNPEKPAIRPNRNETTDIPEENGDSQSQNSAS